MFNFVRKVVRVVFYDQATASIVSTVRMPVERLPESFAADTELKMGGVRYLVVRAEPPTKMEFGSTKFLKIVLRKRPE